MVVGLGPDSAQEKKKGFARYREKATSGILKRASSGAWGCSESGAELSPKRDTGSGRRRHGHVLLALHSRTARDLDNQSSILIAELLRDFFFSCSEPFLI